MQLNCKVIKKVATIHFNINPPFSGVSPRVLSWLILAQSLLKMFPKRIFFSFSTLKWHIIIQTNWNKLFFKDKHSYKFGGSQLYVGWERKYVLLDRIFTKHWKISGKLRANHILILITFLCIYQLKKFFITTKQSLITDIIIEWNKWLAERIEIR